MGIIFAIIIFSIIVIVHELGHFLLAKKNGIGVTEFSIGMGPRLCSFVKNETRYSIKLFPIGGSCAMIGEDELVEDESAFNKKSVWARISVVVAGPIFNFILAFFLAVIMIGIGGYDPAKILSVESGKPAAEAGLKEGDIVTQLNGKKIHFAREMSFYMAYEYAAGEPLNLTYVRDGQKNTVTMTPDKLEDGTYRFYFGYNARQKEKLNPSQIIPYSFYEVKYLIDTTIKSISMLVQGQFGIKDMAGPVGIVNMIGDTYNAEKEVSNSMAYLSLFSMTILLSANLGVMNLLPLPALDGGRLVFLLIEVVRGKPINQEKEGLVHTIGLIALMVLMAVVMFNDIGRLR